MTLFPTPFRIHTLTGGVFGGEVVRAQLRYHYAIGGVYPIPHPDPSIWRGAGVILVPPFQAVFTLDSSRLIAFNISLFIHHCPLHTVPTKPKGEVGHVTHPLHPSFEKISEGADLFRSYRF
ncbi:hypothetical protein CEXT_19051 [Caerostris extrusa]|uniref:Uncharacterized protein n=1 Tax=Caerostris extrusa TaxID=172846 RepID=A0AAV4PAX7_CAEEX|nr:hypothetical protein CEXT_19051 [Caerostris extrusa]